tara:strand:- start:21 stop:890 length:870 start_codon:yes stop_codon:yes gene_type:complete
MTRIAPSHVKASDAVARVAAVFRSVGALCEEIRNDYGEDIILQPQFEGEADRFRIFGQVKYLSRGPLKDGVIRIPLGSSHVKRWIGFVEPFRVFVYCGANQKLYSFDPARQVSIWDIYTTSKKSQTFKISEHDELSESNVSDLVWRCRISHLSRLMSMAESQIELSERAGIEIPENARQSISLLSFELLRFLGVAEGGGISLSYLTMVENAATNFVKHGDALGLRAAFMLALMGQEPIVRVGLPHVLMENGTEMAGMFVRSYRPDLWARLKDVHPKDEWLPFGLEAESN